MDFQAAVLMPIQHFESDHFDGMGRFQPFGTNLGAIHDGAAAEQAVCIIQIIEPLLRRAITAVKDEPVGLNQTRRPDEFVRIPPERWTLAAAAGAQDALISTVQLVAFGG